METLNCQICGTIYNINRFFLNFDERDQTKSNVLLLCEECRNQFNMKIMISAMKTCKMMGMKVDKNGAWKYDDENVRIELESVRALQEENAELKKDIIIWQEKLKSLVGKYGYDVEIELTPNQQLLYWDLKKEYHCPECGRLLIWFKRDGRYYGNCKCGVSFFTEIERLIVNMVVKE